MSEVNGFANANGAERAGAENAVIVGWDEVKSGDIFSFNNGKAFYTDGYSDIGYRVIDLLRL